MRTTVDLPSGTHRRARQLAQRRGRSLSSVLAELVQRALAEEEEDEGVSRIVIHPVTGFPTIDIGRPVTQAEVEDFLDEDE